MQELGAERLVPSIQKGVHVSGTLEGFTLFDLVVSLSQAQQPRKLYILVGDDEAQMMFDRGQCIAAAFGDALGDEAVIKIFGEIDDSADVEFLFEALDPLEASLGEARIETHIEKLLLIVASALDKKRAGSA